MKKILSFSQLEEVSGGSTQTVDEYLKVLYKKYGGTSLNEVLARASEEETARFNHLFYNWSIF